MASHDGLLAPAEGGPSRSSASFHSLLLLRHDALSTPPTELLDHVDFLHESSEALKSCCLVSKLWVPRTRTHLFADIQFHIPSDLEAWKVVFPDRSTSLACYTKSLFICCPHVVAAAGIGEGSWLSTFSHITHLGVEIEGRELDLILFHGF